MTTLRVIHTVVMEMNPKLTDYDIRSKAILETSDYFEAKINPDKVDVVPGSASIVHAWTTDLPYIIVQVMVDLYT